MRRLIFPQFITFFHNALSFALIRAHIEGPVSLGTICEVKKKLKEVCEVAERFASCLLQLDETLLINIAKLCATFRNLL